ncbi:uncharacterized protein LOC131236918 [Magnolia sinica]|uniref:uncharacterized protein LOC131236918 n=1 Tax=Magnolia sinica TaxID=86752 RepID=UPI00265AD659|nr:uncharacterized protein LOC131236918 [Magnolia sinica]
MMKSDGRKGPFFKDPNLINLVLSWRRWMKLDGQKGDRFPSLIDLVLSWSIEDIFDEERYIDKVKKIPETFPSVEDYVVSYIFPLIEETRADLYSTLEAVSDAPFAEITAIKESKHASDLSYFIEVSGWKHGSGLGNSEIYKPIPGDILILSNRVPEVAADLQRYGTTYFLASVTDPEILFTDEKENSKSVTLVSEVESDNEYHKGFGIKVSMSIEVADGMGNSLYAIYLTNLTTNNRIWKALSLGIDEDNKNLNMIREVLYTKPLDVSTCNACSYGQIDVWATKFYGDLISLNLNASQMHAILSALTAIQCKHSHSFKLIWGPPGTGKTKTTSALLWVLLDMNCRTLTCAPTNVAVTQVCSRLLSLVKEYRGRNNENGFSCFSLGDVVLFGNKDRMSIDENSQLEEIFLDYRAEQLAKCFAPASGWKHMLVSLISLLEDCVPQYHAYLEDETEEETVSFREFIKKRFKAIAVPLSDCMRLLRVHLARNFISENESANIGALFSLLETFGSLLCTRGVSNKELEEIFLPEDPLSEYFPSTDVPLSAHYMLEGSARKALDKMRRECLRILRVLKDTLHLPLIIGKDWIKGFCLKNATLIFCTASTASLLRYYEMEPLEVVVIDEAAQLKECESVIPLRTRGIQHAVLIGDERQLPSLVKSKVSEEAGFGRSLFERLGLLGHQKHLLDIQYRMHPAISAFPNAKFYNGQLLDGPNVTDASYEQHYLQGSMYGSYSFIHIADGREEMDDVGNSRKNMVEVAVVLKIIRSLFKSWDGMGQSLSIGVVSPYSAQVNAIQEKIANQYEMHNGFSLKVRSVDGFQGGEMDIIILSTVRSNSKGSVGFLANFNRTNVALTRARHCLWILGNASTLIRSDSVWEELVYDAKERGCFFNADEDKGLAKAILQVKNELNQLDDLLKADSVLLNTARWKVLFSDDFRKSFAKIKHLQIKQAVIQLLLRLADGWRPKSKSLDFPDSFQLAKQFRVRELSLVWMVDIVKDGRYFQVLKVWDIVPMTEIPKLVKRLDNVFAMYTDAYIEHCRVKCFEGKLEVPKSWNIGYDIIRYQKLCKTENVAEARSAEFEECMENSKVSESLLLMKFYSLSSGVVKHLLTDNEGKEIDIPFEVTDQEKEIICFPSSTFILGRSGTGKTTVLTMKLIQREQQYLLSLKGLSDVKVGLSEVVYEKSELSEDTEEVKENFLRQIFITVSPKLCAAIRSHIRRLQSFTSGGDSSGSASSTDMHDISDSLTDFIDIPDSFIDIPQRHYPLVITFQKFLMMLDGTMSNSYFNKFHSVRELSMDTRGVSKSPALQAFIRSKEVTYEHFIATYWPHFNAQLTKKLDPSTVFTQIISHIKGGVEAGDALDGKLRREGYLLLSEGRVSTLSSEERERIYNIFLDYEKKKAEKEEFDLSDLVTDLHQQLRCEGYFGEKVDFVYIDEVQDLTMRQIALFKYLCKNVQEGFVFAGDTAQTIARGIDFRFQDIRSLFYKEFLYGLRSGSKEKGNEKDIRVSEIFHLNQNFRTHAGVLKLSQSVIDLLYCFFPLSIDPLSPETSLIYGEAPVLLDSGNDENAIITIFGSSGSTRGVVNGGFGAEQVILVRDDFDKKQIFEHVGKQALVLTIVECKGLEFQDVLLYNFFGASPLKNHWRVIYNYMEEQDLLDSKSRSFPCFDSAKHSILCSELKQLYVAITRTRQRLWICESIDEFSKPMFDYWKKLCLVQVRHLDSSLAQAMRAASTPDDWRLRGIQLFNEHNFEMATMCFERAGDEFREKWAKAAGHYAHAERILSTNFEEARTALTQAAEIYESIGKAETAAKCFITLKEYERAGMIYWEKCGVSKLEDAGDCFDMAKCWPLAAKVYAEGKCFYKCLSVCTKGELFDLGLQFIEQWKEDSSLDDFKSQEVDGVRTSFLESCALHYLELGDSKRMMKFVKAFPSMDLIRTFLKSRNFLDDLVVVEMESENYMEAADIARMKGDLLLEADILEKAGHFNNASRLIILHVVISSLWAGGSKGWPLKSFPQKEELLMRAKSLAEQASNVFYESICAEVGVLSDQATSLLNLSDYLNTARKFQNVRLEIFAARKILDIHLQSEPSKFHWESETVLDLGKHANEMVAQNSFSVETLIYFWNLWKEMILNVLSYVQLPGKSVAKDCSAYEEFCLEYFGVRKQDNQNTFIALNSEACWIKASDTGSLQRDRNMVSMNARQFMSCSQDFFALELPSVGMKVLERLELLHGFSTKKPLRLFCQGQVILHMFGIAKFLNESKLLDLKYSVGKLKRSLAFCKRCFFYIVFPLDCGKSMTESMVALRESGIARDILEEILIENLNQENGRLTHGQIGRAVMLIFISGRLTEELYQKIKICLDQMPHWKAFVELLKTYMDIGFGRIPLLCKFQKALASTFTASWREYDYISPHCFMYLFECLMFLASSCLGCGGFFYTTKTTFFEMATCEVWKGSLGPCLAVQDKQFQSTAAEVLEFMASAAEQLLNDKRGMREWVKMMSAPYSYYHILMSRLVVIICLAYLNSERDLSKISMLLLSNEILSDLPKQFSDKLRRGGRMRNRGQILRIVAEALEATGNRLVVVSSENNRSKFLNLNALIVTPESIQSREHIIHLLFPKDPKSIFLKDHKHVEEVGNSSRTNHSSGNNTGRDDTELPSNNPSKERRVSEITNEIDNSVLQTKYGQLWDTFDMLWESFDIILHIKVGGENASSLAFNAFNPPETKALVDESIHILDAATALLSQKEHQQNLDGNLTEETKSMLSELKQLSNALDARKEELRNKIPMMLMLCQRLRERKPRLQPILDTLFLPGDQNTVEEGPATSASSDQSQGNKGKKISAEVTAPATSGPSNQSKSNKAKENNKSRQKRKGKNKKR